MSIVYSTLNHPLRVPLAAEIHSRPPVRLEAPEAITHLAIHGRNEPRAPGDRLGMQSGLGCQHPPATPSISFMISGASV